MWKILDFGVSKVIGEHTVENAIIGTPNFMSPEQANRRDVDGRTDIFALGAILYYAITGALAFDGETWPRSRSRSPTTRRRPRASGSPRSRRGSTPR